MTESIKSCYIKLTRGQIAIIDQDDYKAISQFKWQAHYDPSLGQYYAVDTRWHKEKKVYYTARMHREIMNCPNGMEVDHINGNKLDNRKCNLRICTRTQNMHNRKKYKNSTNNYKGVFRHGEKWRASIMANRKKHYLGVFETEIEAYKAYQVASKKYHGEFSSD